MKVDGDRLSFSASDGVVASVLPLVSLQCAPFAIGAAIYLLDARVGLIGGVVAAALGLLGICLGLRCSLRIEPGRVRVVRSLWGLPYRWYSAHRVEDVWYGGDWGEPEGAVALVVQLDDGREVSVGSPGTMHALRDALYEVVQRQR